MTDILFDYHIALAMAQSEDGGSEKNSLTYREAVLKKHDYHLGRLRQFDGLLYAPYWNCCMMCIRIWLKDWIKRWLHWVETVRK